MEIIRSSTPVKGQAGQEELPWQGEKSQVPEPQCRHGGSEPPAAQAPHRQRGAKQVPEASFLLTLFFPARLKELLKLPSNPGSPRGSLGFLHSELSLPEEIKMNFK